MRVGTGSRTSMGTPAVVFICGGWVAAVRELALIADEPGEMAALG